MKKIVCSLVAGSFLIAGAVSAEEPVVIEETVNTGVETTANEEVELVEEDSTTETDFELFDFVDVFQSTLVDLTDNEKERLALLLEFVATTNGQLEMFLQEGQFEQAALLLEKYNQDLEYINELVENEQQETEEVLPEEADLEEDLENDMTEEVTEKASMRGVNLQNLLEREDLPEQAKAGIAKALANQERAAANRQRALERKEQRQAEKESTEISEEELADESAKHEAGEAENHKAEKQQPKNENAQKGLERAEQAKEKAKQKAEQAQKRGHEAKEEGQSRGQAAKEKAQQKGPGNGNPGRP